MPNNEQVSQEYLLIKCFLYKYTPPFTKQANVTSALSTFTPYSMPLDDTKYFTKYDISQFVTSYSFEQNIGDTTYSWSVELQDLALSYGTINTKLKVQPLAGNTLKNGLSFSTSSDSIGLLSQYETNSNTFNNNDSTNFDSNEPIYHAKYQRGLTPGPLTAQNTNLSGVLSTVSGLRLSDLIQEYDFISVYLYKNTTPLTNIYGVFTIDDSIDNNPIQIFNYKITSDTPPAFQNYQNPVDPYLKYESVLLSKIKLPNGESQSLFSNEFNGFVMRKVTSSSINQVDRVTVSGNGWSRLFGSTRRAIKPSLFQNSLYQSGQVLGLSDISAFETIYAGQSISSIITDLFDLVYRIDFNKTTSTAVSAAAKPLNANNSTNLSTSTQIQQSFFKSPTGNASATPIIGPQLPPLGSSFFNITSLIVANSYPANLFSLPQYLLSTVMKLRPFAYIEPINFPVSDAFINGAVNAAANASAQQTASGQQATVDASSASSVPVSPAIFQQTIQNYDVAQQVINYTSTSPVFIDPQVQNLTTYFQFLDQVFLQFSPRLQTPYEILDQIRAITFTEIFEQPNGQFIVRSPQYNNMATSVPGRSDISLIRSSNLNVISTSYGESVENLVSKLFMAYSVNGLPEIPGVNQFGYCDGKLLMQDGLMEMETSANPNVNTQAALNSNTNNSQTTGIFGYAEYLMELANAKLKTGSIACDLDNTVQVGQTFVDETRFKFGYIIGLSKHVAVAGTATMSLNLSYVRDAVPVYGDSQNPNKITDINTDLLPVLTDIENSFSGQ